MKHLALFVGLLTATACQNGSGQLPSTPISPTPSGTSTPTVTTVSVTGASPIVGATSQFTATAALSDNTTQTVTPQATWASSNASVATVSSAGLVTGVNAGSADISATYQTVTAVSHLTVIRPTFMIHGVVRDGTSNGVLPNILVSSLDSANVTRTTTTNGSGGYLIGGVAAGVVAVTFSATSYLPTTRSITVTDQTQVNVWLSRDGSSTPPSTTPTLFITMRPSSVDFGTHMVNTTSTPATVTLTNTTSTLQPLYAFRMGGYQWTDFAQVNDCPPMIAVGASCTFTITFRPSGTGRRIGGLVVDATFEEMGWVGLLGTGTN